MHALRSVILGAGLLLAAPSFAGDDDAESARARLHAEAARARLHVAIPTSALPVTGTVGEIPAGALEIGILADGTYLCDGKEFGLEELDASLRRHAAEGKRSEVGSGLDLVLRVDRDAPWPLVTWCMHMCASPTLRILRLYFAVAPEAGGPEGVLDSFLPPDGSIWAGVRAHGLLVRLLPELETADRGAVYSAMKALIDASAASPVDAELDVSGPRFVRTGHVLTLMDLALRAGARKVNLVGPTAPLPRAGKRGVDPALPGVPGSLDWLRAWAEKQRRDVPAGLKVRIAGLPFVGGAQAKVVPLPPPPPRGRLVVDPNSDWPEVPEEDLVDVPSVNVLPPQSPLPTPPASAPPPAEADPAIRSQQAIDLALAWLATHPYRNGSWGAEGFPYWCDGRPLEASTLDGKGKARNDVGVTGLALLAFLGAGVSSLADTSYGKVLARGLRFLRSVQDVEGCVGPRLSGHFIYNHAIATLALVEAYGAAPSPTGLEAAQKALDFVALARNPNGVWRYGVQPEDGDTSITGWMFLALDAARRVNAAAPKDRPSPFTVDPKALDATRTWIEAMTDPDTGRLGYQQRGSGSARHVENIDAFPAEKVEGLTAVGVFVRTRLGEDPAEDVAVAKGLRLVTALPPTWNAKDGSIDMYAWHFEAIAMAQDVEPAPVWQAALVTALADHQRTDGDACGARGSWDPIDPWGPDGGRVYATAISVLALQAPVTHGRKAVAGK